MKVPSAGGSTKHIAEGKGVHCEVESEGSRRQTTGPTDRNRIRHSRVDKSAYQDEVPSYPEPEV